MKKMLLGSCKKMVNVKELVKHFDKTKARGIQ